MMRWLFAVVIGLMQVGVWAQTFPATRPAGRPEGSSPKATLRQLFDATDAGDEQAIRALLDARTPEEERTALLTAQTAAAVVRFNQAVSKAFGEEQAKKMLGDTAAARRNRDALMGQVTETIDGDNATVKLDAFGKEFLPMALRQTQGQWKVVVTPLREAELAAVGIQIKVLNDVTADIAAGKHQSPAEVNQAVSAKLRQENARLMRAATTRSGK